MKPMIFFDSVEQFLDDLTANANLNRME